MNEQENIAYAEGRRAYQDQEDVLSNPYRDGTERYEDWLRGWMDEQFKLINEQ